MAGFSEIVRVGMVGGARACTWSGECEVVSLTERDGRASRVNTNVLSSSFADGGGGKKDSSARSEVLLIGFNCSELLDFTSFDEVLSNEG